MCRLVLVSPLLPQQKYHISFAPTHSTGRSIRSGNQRAPFGLGLLLAALRPNLVGIGRGAPPAATFEP